MSLLRASALGALSCLFAACATDPNDAGASAVQFQDVVVPSGLRLRDEANESYSRDESGWRQGHFVYSGQIDVAAAANYVRERMPQHKWTKVQDEQTQEAGLRLRFERGIYRAEYAFTRAEGSTTMVVDYTTNHSRQ
ncbi:MAG: hypothetical protein JNK15_03960 [Planctomycetes bacterium]|nr:hypothetical protein [Planctomycetota bacterium]